MANVLQLQRATPRENTAERARTSVSAFMLCIVVYTTTLSLLSHCLRKWTGQVPHRRGARWRFVMHGCTMHGCTDRGLPAPKRVLKADVQRGARQHLSVNAVFGGGSVTQAKKKAGRQPPGPSERASEGLRGHRISTLNAKAGSLLRTPVRQSCLRLPGSRASSNHRDGGHRGGEGQRRRRRCLTAACST